MNWPMRGMFATSTLSGAAAACAEVSMALSNKPTEPELGADWDIHTDQS